MFQKCPICNGTGTNIIPLSEMTVPCSVCNGTNIISELTGFPPGYIPDEMLTEDELRRMKTPHKGIYPIIPEPINFDGAELTREKWENFKWHEPENIDEITGLIPQTYEYQD